MEEEESVIDDGIEDSASRQECLNNILPKAGSNFRVKSQIISDSESSGGPL